MEKKQCPEKGWLQHHQELGWFVWCQNACSTCQGSVTSVWRHSWVLWQSPDTPVMSCFQVSVQLRACSSRALSLLHALFRVGAWCLYPDTHGLSFSFVSGFGHSRSVFCLVVWVYGLARSRTLLSTCLMVCTQFVFLSAACISRVCVLFCTWLVICFAGHVLMFLFCVSIWLLS